MKERANRGKASMINGTGEGCQGLSRTHRTCAFRVMKFHIAGYISMRFCESYPMILLTHLSVNVQGYNIIIIINTFEVKKKEPSQQVGDYIY